MRFPPGIGFAIQRVARYGSIRFSMRQSGLDLEEVVFIL
jgi:hypothetical protein